MLTNVIDIALTHLTPRQQYAADVIRGSQLWSGADLKGAAKRWGQKYQKQRDCAMVALRAAGGCVVACDTGRLRTAVYVGMDDYGNPIVQTRKGAAILGNLTYRHV